MTFKFLAAGLLAVSFTSSALAQGASGLQHLQRPVQHLQRPVSKYQSQQMTQRGL